MTKQELIAASVSTLKRKLKTATPKEACEIIAELNARGIFPRRK